MPYLGQGQYSFTPLDSDQDVPFFMFGNIDEWFLEKFQATPGDVIDRVMNGRRPELAAALDSVLIGRHCDRLRFYEGTPRDSSDFVAARHAYHDEHRSSMNDIGGRAYRIAQKLRAGQPVRERAPQQVFTQ